MPESKSLRRRLLTDLTRNISVTLTAIALALAAFFLLPFGNFEGRLLLALSFMTITYVYDDYWPVTYGTVYAVLWTIGAGLVTVGVFVSVSEFVLYLAADEIAVATAFLVTVGLQYGSAILYSRAVDGENPIQT